MVTQISRPLFLQILAAVFLSSCAAISGHSKISGKDTGPSDIYPEPGEAVWIAEDTPMLQVQGTTVTAVDHQKFTRGKYGAVVPLGARVEAVDLAKNPRAKASGSDAPLAHMNPWVYVRVVESRYDSQVGWEGWVHNSAFSLTQSSDPAPPSLEISKPSKMCPFADANTMQCAQQVGAGTLVRKVGCSARRVHVELWLEDGRYTNGHINKTQLSDSPCP